MNYYKQTSHRPLRSSSLPGPLLISTDRRQINQSNSTSSYFKPIEFKDQRFQLDLPKKSEHQLNDNESDKGSDGYTVHECDIIISRKTRKTTCWCKLFWC